MFEKNVGELKIGELKAAITTLYLKKGMYFKKISVIVINYTAIFIYCPDKGHLYAELILSWQ